MSPIRALWKVRGELLLVSAETTSRTFNVFDREGHRSSELILHPDQQGGGSVNFVDPKVRLPFVRARVEVRDGESTTVKLNNGQEVFLEGR